MKSMWNWNNVVSFYIPKQLKKIFDAFGAIQDNKLQKKDDSDLQSITFFVQ